MEAAMVDRYTEQERRKQDHPKTGEPLGQISLPRPRAVPQIPDRATTDKIAAEHKEDDHCLIPDRDETSSGASALLQLLRRSR
jgi:hypothetical protein